MSHRIEIPAVEAVEITLHGFDGVFRLTPMSAMNGNETDVFVAKLKELRAAAESPDADIATVIQYTNDLLLLASDIPVDILKQLQGWQRRRLLDIATTYQPESDAEKKTRR